MSSNNSELKDVFDEDPELPRRQITINVFKENQQLIEQTVTPVQSVRKQRKGSLKKQESSFVYQDIKNFIKEKNEKYMLKKVIDKNANDIISLDEFTERNDQTLRLKKLNKKANQLEFNSQDRESLENAKIDKNLLNNYFNESNENQNFIKDKFL